MLLAGALATVVACFGVAPAEAVRIRCCSTQDTSSVDTVSGIPVLAAMVANNGALDLWKGLPPLMVRQILFGMMKFLVFDFFPPVVTAAVPGMPSVAVQLISGGVAGVMSTVVSQPGDAILTRMAQTGDSQMGVLEAARSLWQGEAIAPTSSSSSAVPRDRESGPGAFFIGVGSRSLWAGCVIAGQFLLYDLFKSALGVSTADLEEVFDVFGTLE